MTALRRLRRFRTASGMSTPPPTALREFLIYLPFTPVADLPEGFRSWVGSQLVDADNNQLAELPFYGLYNVTTQEGFSGLF